MNRLSVHFLFLCLAIVLIVVYFVFEPFLGPLILAGVFSFLFQPFYRRVLRALGGYESIAALATTLCAIVLVVLPLTLIGIKILQESADLYASVTSGGREGLLVMIEDGIEQLRRIAPVPQEFHIDASQYVRQALGGIVQNLGSFFSSVARGTLMLFVFLVSLYFLLKDGRKLENYVIELSPLLDTDDEFIVQRLKLAVTAVVKGSLSISLIQGALTGIGFAIFGMPSPVLWGAAAALAALVPGIGTALILIPGVLYLFFTGSTQASAGLAIWGVVAVGLVDNFLGPKIIGRGIQLHPLAAFLAVLGGLALFGPLGFLLGPLAVSLFLALLEIYFSLRHKERAST